MHVAHHYSTCLADKTVTVHAATGIGKLQDFHEILVASELARTTWISSYPPRNPTVFSKLT